MKRTGRIGVTGRASAPYALAVAWLVASVAVPGCDLIDSPETVPAYLRIDSVRFTAEPEQGFPSHQFTDVWVTANGPTVGVFELPAVFPVFATGPVSITVGAGIKENGISATRTRYVVTDLFQTTVQMNATDTVVLDPVVTYTDGVAFPLLEDFEMGHDFEVLPESDADIETPPEAAFEGSRGMRVRLPEDSTLFVIQTETPLVLPTGGQPVYLEVDYRGNMAWDVVLRAVPRDGSAPITSYLLTVGPRDDWNKIYVNLTGPLGPLDHSDFQLRFVGFVPDSLDVGEVNWDNIKIVELL